MGTIFGLVRQRGPSLDSERRALAKPGCPYRWPSVNIFVYTGCLLACSTVTPVTSPPVNLSPDQQTLVITSADPTAPRRFTLESLPPESTIAPGLYFRPKRFGLVQVSPNGRYAAFSTVDHHTLVGLLDLSTMVVQEIDVVTEGEVLNFHWAPDSHLFLYDYRPASGYQRVRGYDLQSGEGLVVSRTHYRSATHLAFAEWGFEPREVILSMKERPTDEPRTTRVMLISRNQPDSFSKPRP